jgi:hypothetical protein
MRGTVSTAGGMLVVFASLLLTTPVSSFVPTSWRSSPGLQQLHPVFQPPVLSDSDVCGSSSSSTTALTGIPKMFRWLTDQYPDILNRQLEAEGLAEDISVDNFYLDMNGIIHPCTHGNAEGEIIILDETAMFKKIFLYVDRYVITVIQCMHTCIR